MPLISQLHVDGLLSNVSIKYDHKDLFIAMQVFPEVMVKKESDLFRVYDRNLRAPESQRAPRSEAQIHQFEVTTSTYILKRHSLKTLVTDHEAQNYDLADLRKETTEELTRALLARLELDMANLFTTTSWSLNVSLTSTLAWNANTIISDPAPIWHTGASTILANGGMKPNFGILPRDAFIACKNHTSVLDRLKYTTAEVDEKKLAAMFDVDSLLVPSASYDQAPYGFSVASAGFANSLTSFYGDVAFLGWKPSSAGPLKPSAGYVFRNSLPMVKRYREEKLDGEFIEVNMEYSARVIASLSGYLIKDVV